MTLTVRGLVAGYGDGTVLHGVDLDVPTGGAVGVLGRNGAGKTTLVHTIAGLVRARGGSVKLDGTELAGLPAHRIARVGTALVPQGRRVFASLTVAEHLTLSRKRGTWTRERGDGAWTRERGDGAWTRERVGGAWTRERVLELLPRLGERLRHRGDQLSGGEAQQLAIARALLTQPRLLLLDEPCEGLAVDLAARVRALVATLAQDLTVLITAQQPADVFAVAAQVVLLDNGHVVDVVGPDADPSLVDGVLSVRARPVIDRQSSIG